MFCYLLDNMQTSACCQGDSLKQCRRAMQEGCWGVYAAALSLTPSSPSNMKKLPDSKNHTAVLVARRTQVGENMPLPRE